MIVGVPSHQIALLIGVVGLAVLVIERVVGYCIHRCIRAHDATGEPLLIVDEVAPVAPEHWLSTPTEGGSDA